MMLFAAVLALAPILQEESIYRQKVEEIVRQLDAENPDVKWLRELDPLPSTLIPLLRELAPADKHPLAAKRIAAAIPPDPWPRIIRRSIGNARENRLAWISGQSNSRFHLLPEVLKGLSCLSPAEAKAILETLARDKEPGIQGLAAMARPFLFPDPKTKYATLLGDPSQCEQAADLILLNGETAAIRPAVDLFCRQEMPESRAAGRVLEVFGAGDFSSRILGVLEGKGKLSDSAVPILMRTGGKGVEKGLLAQLQSLPPGSPRGYALIQALQVIGSGEAGPAIRKFYAGLDAEKLKSMSNFPLLGHEGALQIFEATRKEQSRFGPHRLRHLHAHAYPELRPAVRAWAADPQVKPSELKFILPLLGAVGDKSDAALLLQKLEDPRVAGEAAEGLAMIGDPAHGPAVWKAYARREATTFLNNSMLSFPTEAIEAEVVATIKEGRSADPRVLQIIRRDQSPALRKAVFERLLDTEARWVAGWEIAIVLGAGRNDEEKAQIDKLRAQGHPMYRTFAHYMAMCQGDAAAADALVSAISGQQGMFLDARAFAWWSSFEKAGGDNWTKALERQWAGNPTWLVGAYGLARAGNKQALETLVGQMSDPKFGLREKVTRLQARSGDPKAMEWVLDRLLRSPSHDQGDDDPADDLLEKDPEFSKRVIVLARTFALRQSARPLELLAERTLPEARPLYLLGALHESVPCLRALFRLKDPDAFPIAVRLLRSGRPYARIGAVRALEEWGGRPAVPHLASRLDDMEEPYDVSVERSDQGLLREPPNPRIAVAAMAALEKLTGVIASGASHAEHRAFWKEWHAKNPDGGK